MNTELVLGFDPSHLTDEHVVRQQKLWDVWTQGLFSLPINLPGFGKANIQLYILPKHHNLHVCC